MIILTIDSGIEKTGIAVFNSKQQNNYGLITSGCIKTSSKQKIQLRLLEIYKKLSKIIIKYKPNLIVLERLFFFKNQKTVISVSQAQGIVLLLTAENKINVDFLTPLQIKEIITGYGQADKKSVQKMLKLIYNIDIKPSQDDEADAIACGLAYCQLNQRLVE